MSTLAKIWEDHLRARGYRLTKARRAVLETMASETGHRTPEEIHRQARWRYRKLGLVTVYRTLALLERLNLVQRVHQGKMRCHSFAAVRLEKGHHHQLICRTCGHVEEFPDCALDRTLRKLQARTGFAIESHHLEVVGQCPKCQ